MRDFDRGRLGSLASLILDGVMYVPAISEFNDPWEASAWYQVPQGNEALALTKFLMRKTSSADVDQGWGPSLVQDFQRKISSLGLPAVVAELQSQHRFLFASRPVLCVAEKPDIPLMWSYYASAHTGYVLEFDASMSPFNKAVPARYEFEYPTIDLHTVEDPSRALQESLLIKGEFWRHEHEWRVIEMNRSKIFDLHPIQPAPPAAGALIQLPKGALRRVIVGRRMDVNTAERIARVCGAATPPIPTARCELAAGAFRVIVPNG